MRSKDFWSHYINFVVTYDLFTMDVGPDLGARPAAEVVISLMPEVQHGTGATHELIMLINQYITKIDYSVEEAIYKKVADIWDYNTELMDEPEGTTEEVLRYLNIGWTKPDKEIVTDFTFSINDFMALSVNIQDQIIKSILRMSERVDNWELFIPINSTGQESWQRLEDDSSAKSRFIAFLGDIEVSLETQELQISGSVQDYRRWLQLFINRLKTFTFNQGDLDVFINWTLMQDVETNGQLTRELVIYIVTKLFTDFVCNFSLPKAISRLVLD